MEYKIKLYQCYEVFLEEAQCLSNCLMKQILTYQGLPRCEKVEGDKAVIQELLIRLNKDMIELHGNIVTSQYESSEDCSHLLQTVTNVRTSLSAALLVCSLSENEKDPGLYKDLSKQGREPAFVCEAEDIPTPGPELEMVEALTLQLEDSTAIASATLQAIAKYNRLPRCERKKGHKEALQKSVMLQRKVISLL